MLSRRAMFAAGVAAMFVAAASPCRADLSIDPLRGDGSQLAALRCPERIAKVAAQAAAPARGARSVQAEFIDGEAHDGSARTLDLDVTEGGKPRRAFRIRFPPLGQTAQFMLALFMNDGSSRAACVVDLAPRAAGFTVEFPLADFRQALGLADYSDVDYILMVTRRASLEPAAARVLSIKVASGHEQGALIARCR
jgi:hypothetical protein